MGQVQSGMDDSGTNTQVLHDEHHAFWRAASSAAAELMDDPTFEQDKERLRQMRDRINVVTRCRGRCSKEGGWFRPRQYVIQMSEYRQSRAAVQSLMDFVKSNHTRITRRHKSTWTWMQLPKPDALDIVRVF